MTLLFTKMHGLGNDFIMVNGFQESLPADLPALAKKLCHRRFGIGADGLIVLRPHEEAAFRMSIYNADGSEPEMCGNGSCCSAVFAREQGILQANSFIMQTLAGPIGLAIVDLPDGQQGVRVDMGEPRLKAEQIPASGEGRIINRPLDINRKIWHYTAVSMGNPHCVFFVPDVETAPVTTVGPLVENNLTLFPKKVNVEFAQIISEQTIKMRVWERGCGETMACGTGACATAVAACLNHLTGRQVDLELRGGTLEIDWAANNHVYMVGKGIKVYTGECDV